MPVEEKATEPVKDLSEKVHLCAAGSSSGAHWYYGDGRAPRAGPAPAALDQNTEAELHIVKLDINFRGVCVAVTVPETI